MELIIGRIIENPKETYVKVIERVILAQLGLYETCYIREHDLHTSQSFEEWTHLYDIMARNKVLVP